MKKTMKILSVVMVVAVLMLTMAFAFDAPQVGNASTAGVSQVTDDITKATQSITGIVYTAGLSIALIVIVVFGVQWIVATPAKKADLKGKMWNIVIGVAILVGATFILTTIGTFFEGFTDNDMSSSQQSGSGNEGARSEEP